MKNIILAVIITCIVMLSLLGLLYYIALKPQAGTMMLGGISSVEGLGYNNQPQMQRMAASPKAAAREIIYQYSMSLKADDPLQIMNQVTSLTLQNKGYISQSMVNVQPIMRIKRSSDFYITMELAVPKDKVDGVMTSLRQLNNVEVVNETASTQDVTVEHQDIKTSLSIKENIIAQYQSFLQRATDISDKLEITSRISDAQDELDMLKQSNDSLQKQIDYAKISVTINPYDTTVVTGWKPLDSVINAAASLIQTLKWLCIAIIWFVFYLVPLAIMARLVYLFFKKVYRVAKWRRES